MRTLTTIVRQEGFSALYSGIVPGLQRQMAFSAIRYVDASELGLMNFLSSGSLRKTLLQFMTLSSDD